MMRREMVTMTVFFFRAVNNTFLQISQQRKKISVREKERDYFTRNRKKIKTRMGTGARVHPPQGLS